MRAGYGCSRFSVYAVTASVSPTAFCVTCCVTCCVTWCMTWCMSWFVTSPGSLTHLCNTTSDHNSFPRQSRQQGARLHFPDGGQREAGGRHHQGAGALRVERAVRSQTALGAVQAATVRGTTGLAVWEKWFCNQC